MIDIRNFLLNYATLKGWNLITDTQNGLNVDRDETADRETENDKDAIFLNVIETGTIVSNEIGSSLTVNRTFELGLLKRCIKETDGVDYYTDVQYLIGEAIELYKNLVVEYNVTNGTYDTGVDNLDNNNCLCKLTFTLEETLPNCIL